MKLEKIFVPLISILSIAILIVSYLSWTNKLEMIKSEATTAETQNSIGSKDTTNKQEAIESEDSVAFELQSEELAQVMENTDESVKELLQKRFDAGEKVQMLIVGSAVLDFGEPSYGSVLVDTIEKAYKGFIEPTKYSFDMTSQQFIDEKLDEIDWQAGYDFVLFEPFTLTNSGNIGPDVEQEHIQLFMDQVKSNVEDAVIVLQPSYPLYRTINYKPAIDSLQQFAVDHNIPYINHWEQWPDPDDEELLQYLTKEKNPTQEGVTIWSNVLTKYFTNQ